MCREVGLLGVHPSPLLLQLAHASAVSKVAILVIAQSKNDAM